MMNFLRVAFALLAFGGHAAAQGAMQLAAGQVLGNTTTARAPGQASNLSSIIDRAIGSTRGSILTRNSTAWVLKTPGTSGLPLLSAGAGADVAYGILGLSAGGCNANLTASNGGILYSTASACAILGGTATAGQMLQSGANTAPAWSTATWPATTTINQILYSSAANVVGAIATANNGMLITGGTGIPSITTTLPATNFPALTGDVTTSAGALATTIAANAVTYAKFQQVAAVSLVGNATGSLANATGITLGSTLAFSGSALQTGAGTGDITWSANSFVTTLATVNANTGAWGSATQVAQITLDGKGRATAAANVTIALNAAQSTAALDTLTSCTTQGDLLYRNATTWVCLTPGSSGQVLQSGGAAANPSWLTVTGTGTVTSVGWTGGIVSIANATTTPAFTIAGTSGGIVYFSGASTWASSGALTASALVLGGGAGAAPTPMGSLGTTTTLLHGNAAGAPTFGSLVYADIASGALATNANYLSGAASTLVNAGVIYQAEVTVTYGTTTTFDFSTFNNAVVTLTGNITTMTFSGITAGKSGSIRFIQDVTGSRTSVWNSNLKFAGGTTPTLTTTASAIDVLNYHCVTASYCEASLNKDVK